MKMDELDKEILLHIIELQTRVIEGKDIKTIFRKHMNDFCTQIGADIIAICAKENEQVDFKYILEDKKLFSYLLKKYFPERKKFSWESFVEHCQSHFTGDTEYLKINNFHQVFNGFIPKKSSNSITKELNVNEIIIMPLHAQKSNETFGFVFYIFQNDSQAELKRLKMSTMLFQSLLQPLYDREHYTLYSKCVRVNNKMNLLTAQEKKIVLKVLDGNTYTEIAKIMGVSINTVKSHMKNIFNKYAVTSKIELYNKLHENK